MSSMFESVEQAPSVEVFAVSAAAKADKDPNTTNLSVGVYRTDELKPWVLPVVRNVESQMDNDLTLNKEYLPIAGLPDFTHAALRILFDSGSHVMANELVDGVQALGGTGALFLAYQFLRNVMHASTVYVSAPTWPNHKGLAQLAHYEHIREYRYWDAQRLQVDFNGLLEDLAAAPDRSVWVMHAVAHNPTGMDLSREQWTQIAEIFKTRNLYLIMDIAYQGFASGSLDDDAFAVRLMANKGVEMFVAQSFSKNFGLYNERVGNLAIVSKESSITKRIKSNVEILVRRSWSNPPNHGCRIVATVLNNPALFAEWKENIQTMAERIRSIRKLLYERLRGLGTPGNWDHIIRQIGMFSFTGLTKKQVEYLRNNYHVYALSDGRINMCGISTGNVGYVAQSIHDAVTNA